MRYRPPGIHLLDPSPSDTLQWGTIVEDVDDPGSEIVVVNTPNKIAAEWDVSSRDRTVAEDNPKYPPTDPVIVTVFKEEMDEKWPYYGGARPLRLADLRSKYNLYPYSFPESRLRVVGRLSQPEVSVEDIRPSPYHSRTFSIADNEGFVERIRENGAPPGLPIVREMDGCFEIVNGHKRVWACQVAGIDKIAVQVHRYDNRRAADLWAKNHFGSYTQEQQQTALNKLMADFGMRVFDKLHHLERPEWLMESEPSVEA